MAFEENEVSQRSNGGTELIKRGIASSLPSELVDEFQVICSRVREIQEDKIRVYWIHDLPEDPELNHLKDESSRLRFHKFVFCSNWQYQRFRDYLNFPYDLNAVVIDNPIVPFEAVPKNFDDKIRLVYTSTPHRGLELLVPVFEKLAEKYPNIHLDVFSSFKIYGWDEADTKYEKVFERIRNHPQMTYHGFKPNSEVREALQNAHIFAYPSIWMETSCLCMIEAMSAGLLCVHPNYGALTETSGGLNMMYQGSSDHNEHARAFYHALDQAIEIVAHEDVQNNLRFNKLYADSRYSKEKIVGYWQTLLEGLKQKHPDVESRKIVKQEPYFVYRT